MKLYVLVIYAFLAFASIVHFSIFYHIYSFTPEAPVRIEEKYKSKSKFALFLNKIIRKKYSNLKNEYSIDIFHEVAIWVHFSFFAISLIICFIDISLSFILSFYLKKIITLVGVIILGLPFLYHLCFLLLWEYTSFMQDEREKK